MVTKKERTKFYTQLEKRGIKGIRTEHSYVCPVCFEEFHAEDKDDFLRYVLSGKPLLKYARIDAIIIDDNENGYSEKTKDGDITTIEKTIVCCQCDELIAYIKFSEDYDDYEEEEEANSDNDIVGYMILGNHPNVQLDDQDCYVTCVQCAEDGDEIGSDYITREQAREENEHCDNCGMELSKVRIS